MNADFLLKIGLLLLWVAVVSAGVVKTSDLVVDQRPGPALLLGIVLTLFVVVPMVLLLAVASDDHPHANQLCVRGHEEWHTTRRGPVLIGKVWTPATSSTHKMWVCDEWGSER